MKVEQKITDDALSELASEVILMYPTGAEFCAEDVLAAHPDLEMSRRSVIKVSFEEYCRRYDNQEAIDVNEFVDRFPGIESSLRAEINIHSAVLRDPGQFDKWLSPAWPVPDSQFLDWKLRRLIGRGGFSRVYLADESKVGNRPVALKLTTRAGHECELVGKLNHPGICQILSVRDDGPGGGLTAIAMPFHGEGTLHDLIESVWHGRHTRATPDLPSWGAPSMAEFVGGVATMAMRLCEALEYAHDHSVLHCDLKPSNVLLKSDGAPVLLDFNLAFSTTSGARVLGGTVGYMAPEQIEATLHRDEPREIDVRADVFGLGAVLYHVLGGVPAFAIEDGLQDGDRMLARLASIVSTPPVPLHERNLAVQREISDIVQSCLAADPTCRPQSIGEVRRALETCVLPKEPDPKPLPVTAKRGGWSRRLKVAAWGSAVIAILTAAILLNRPDPVLNLDQEIVRLEAIPDDVITLADRELLAYYYCLDENWLAAKVELESLLAAGYETAAIHHNLTYCRVRLAEDQDAYLGFLQSIAMDPSQGKSWMALAYYDACQTMTEPRYPYLDYLEQATHHCDDQEMVALLTQYVEGVVKFQRERADVPLQMDLPSFRVLQPISNSLHSLPLNRWLVAPEGVSEVPSNKLVATN